MHRRKGILVIGFLFLVLWLPVQAGAQTASSDQTQSVVNQFDNAQGSIFFPSGYRAFPIPGENPLPPTLPVPPHFAPPVTDGNYGPLITILAYKDQYSLGDAEALLASKKGKLRVYTTAFGAGAAKPFLRILPSPKDAKDRQAFKRRYALIGLGNYKAEDPKSISEQVLGMAIKEGLRVGADVLLFQEGAALIQYAKGWSIGLFNSLSVVSAGSGMGTGNVTVGGIGYGRGESGYVSKPWLRVQFFAEAPGVPPRAAFKPTEKGKPPEEGKIRSFEELLREVEKSPPPRNTREEAYTTGVPSVAPPPAPRK
jgi:hypothetical protein